MKGKCKVATPQVIAQDTWDIGDNTTQQIIPEFTWHALINKDVLVKQIQKYIHVHVLHDV